MVAFGAINFFGVFFVLIWVFTIAVFGFVIGKIVMEWQKNNRAPMLSLEAVVLDKRDHCSHHHHHHSGHMHTSHSTTYYVTFEFDNGERAELCVPSTEYGLIIVGDRGVLTFKGTRFLDFQRNAETKSENTATRRL